MIRWLLVGSLLIGMGMGFQRGWIAVDWETISKDLNMPFLSDKEPLRRISDDLYGDDLFGDNSSDRQAP